MADAAAPAPATRPPAGEAAVAWSAAARSTLNAADARLARRFDQGEEVERLVALRARAVDPLIRDAWTHCIAPEAPAALFAVGGYGRGELFPQSDIDLLVLADEATQQALHAALSTFFTMLWDAGLPVSHAVRSAAQCTQAAADQSVLTALIEARPVVADAAAQAALAEAVSPQRAWPARDFFIAKQEELRVRHGRFGDTSDNLEPNLKDGPGGLRDLHTLGWMALRTFGVAELEPLVGLGHVGPDEAAALARERRTLGRLRYGLHLVAGRAEERLLFDHQKTLAARLGHGDDTQSLGVEKMMQAFYRSAAVVRRISDRLLQRFEEQFDGDAQPEPLDAAFALRHGYLSAVDRAWPQADPSQVFALFAKWAAQPQARGLHSQTARALAESLAVLPPYARANARQRSDFMALLRGPRAVETLTRLARLGVLGQWIPAFAQVSGRMQFDLFHVYTVDQHTLMVLRNIAAFSSGRADERFSIAHEVWPRLRKPELLLLAGLFHDIAKGRGGDHSELGAHDARDFCTAHGLSSGDTELVAWLVEQHLRMSVTAQKQDIADPEVIHRFAALIEQRERLDYLYLLTCADIAGTSPKLWNTWKDRLLADLYFAARRVLREGLEHPVDADARLQEARASAGELLEAQGLELPAIEALFDAIPEESFLRFRPEQVAWQARAIQGAGTGQTRVRVRRIAEDADALEVFVHSPDRPGLFAAILATLDRMGFGIHQARVLDGPCGTVFDTFEVLPAGPAAHIDQAEVEGRLVHALAGDLRAVRTSRRAVPRLLKHFRFPPRIEFGATPDGRRTVLSLVASDRPGLLSDIAQVLRAQKINVHDARIATFGERAEDLFQITDDDGRPLDDEAVQQRLREALHAACFESIQ
jgi:[protein-PII] uridylyltransferase